MKFQDKFKPGDIICSDHFYNGLCMVVESVDASSLWKDNEFRYKCQDLVRENEGWCAYENDSYRFNHSYAWRIATDDDIANYLCRFLDIPLGKVGPYEVTLTHEGICFENGFDFNIYFEAEELIQLGEIIKDRVMR